LIDAETYRAVLPADIRSSSIMVPIDVVAAQEMSGIQRVMSKTDGMRNNGYS
jgi:hypothetical protein